MNQIHRTLALAGALIGFAGSAQAAPPSSEAPEVSIVTALDTLEPPMAERLHAQLSEEVAAALEQRGVEVVAEGSSKVIELQIELDDLETLTYAITISLVDSGARSSIASEDCVACRDDKLIETILSELDEVVERLEPTEAPPPSLVEPPHDPLDDRPRLDVGPVGYAGAGAASLGLALTIAGAVTWAKRSNYDPSAPQYNDRSAAGAALLGIGLTAAVLGGAALTYDLAVLRPRRRERARLSLAPGLSPRALGLSIHGSF